MWDILYITCINWNSKHISIYLGVFFQYCSSAAGQYIIKALTLFTGSCVWFDHEFCPGALHVYITALRPTLSNCAGGRGLHMWTMLVTSCWGGLHMWIMFVTSCLGGIFTCGPCYWLPVTAFGEAERRVEMCESKVSRLGMWAILRDGSLLWGKQKETRTWSMLQHVGGSLKRPLTMHGVGSSSCYISLSLTHGYNRPRVVARWMRLRFRDGFEAKYDLRALFISISVVKTRWTTTMMSLWYIWLVWSLKFEKNTITIHKVTMHHILLFRKEQDHLKMWNICLFM